MAFCELIIFKLPLRHDLKWQMVGVRLGEVPCSNLKGDKKKKKKKTNEKKKIFELIYALYFKILLEFLYFSF